MNVVSKWLTVVFYFLFSMASFAEEYSLQSFVKAAIENDSLAKASQKDIEVAKYRSAQARGAFFPNVSASAVLSKSKLSESIGQGDQHVTNESAYYEQGAIAMRAVQPIYRPFISATLRQADFQLDAAIAASDIVVQRAISSATDAYIDALEQKSALEQFELHEQALLRQLSVVAGREKLGLASNLDVLETESRLAILRSQKAKAQSNYESKRNVLSIFIGQSQVEPVSPNIELPEDPNLSMDQLLTSAKLLSPTLRQARRIENAAEEELTKARSILYPTVDFELSRELNINPGNNRLAYDRYRTRGVKASLVINVPIFAGLSGQASIDEKSALIERARFSGENIEKNIHKEISSRYALYIGAHREVKYLRASERLALATMQKYDTAYRAGFKGIVDVLNSQAQYFSTMRDLKSAEYQFISNVVYLKALIGCISTRDFYDHSFINSTCVAHGGL